MISTKPVDLYNGINLYDYPQTSVVGIDKVPMFILPLGLPRIKHAVNDALNKGRGDIIIDATVYSKYWWFIIGEYEIEVRGTAVDLSHPKNQPKSPLPVPNQSAAQQDSQ